jgi:molybdopterin-guanine dinucleotide biosynthesis protein A
MAGNPSWDAIVVAGGRGSRLGGVEKAELRQDGQRLLDRLADGLAGARALVVVGDRGVPGALLVREEPPHGGPAAAVAAGLAALPGGSTLVALLAVDMPRAGEAIPLLLSAYAGATSLAAADGVVAVDSTGRRQPLLGVYATTRLRAAVAAVSAERGGMEGSSLRQLLAPLELCEVPVSDALCADVDTRDDAERLGIAVPEEGQDR